MPSIDSDLFQVLALALLFLTLVALGAILAVLNGIRGALESSTRPGTYEPAPVAAAYEAPGSSGYGYGGAAASSQPTYQEPAYQPSYQQPAPESSTGYVSVAEALGVQPSTAAEPATAATAPEPSPTPAAGAAATPAVADMPEEKPFERDGRWWFKRGEELLVYDEGTGQWQPAPAGALGGAGTAPAPAVSAPEYGTAAPAATAPAGTPLDSGEGWKCASCGAVNGSTATVCRMCFSPR